MDTTIVLTFLKNYWWAFVLSFAIILFAVFARKGILGKRVEELFSWPPKP